MIDKVNVNKDPALADLGARNLAAASLLLQRHRMNVQKRSGRLEIQSIHGAMCGPADEVRDGVTLVTPVPVTCIHSVCRAVDAAKP